MKINCFTDVISFTDTVKLGKMMKLNGDLALEFFKENIQKIPIVKTIRDVTNQNQEYDMEIVLNNSERIFIDVKVFNNIYQEI